MASSDEAIVVDDDDDEDLQAAIRASLQQPQPAARESDAELEEALRLSKELAEASASAAPAPSDTGSASAKPEGAAAAPAAATAPAAAAAAGADAISDVRAMLRQRWASREVSAASSGGAASTSEAGRGAAPQQATATAPAPAAPAGGLFGGALFLNRVAEDRSKHTIDLEGVCRVPGGPILRALVSSGPIIDMALVARTFPAPTELLVVTNWRREDGESPGVDRMGRATVVRPPLNQFGCMHAKLMLLESRAALRVVVSSANLTAPDWAAITQNVYVQDFARRPPGGDPAPPDKGGFGGYLDRFLAALTVPGDWRSRLSAFDFSPAKAVLVASVPGSHSGPALQSWGHTRLAEVLSTGAAGRGAGAASDPFYFQASSVGNLNPGWVSEFSRSASGLPPAPASASRGKKRASPGDDAPPAEEAVPPLRVVFPTHAEVATSRLGTDGAGTTVLRRDHYNSPAFPRSSLSAAEAPSPARAGVLWHSKVLSRGASLLYAGSANLSASAWGRLAKGGSQLSVNNYELGVAFPAGVPPSEFPLPFKFPPRPYRPNESPWHLM
eukprot:tig00020684_g12872.t1